MRVKRSMGGREYANGRYVFERTIDSTTIVCKDINLDRNVSIHWVAPGSKSEIVRARLAALQVVHSPYLSLTYDMIEDNGTIGVVEEHFDRPARITESNRIRRLYDFSAALAALHQENLAHGALDEQCFRVDPLDHGRLCHIAFDKPGLEDPAEDRGPFRERLFAMEADRVSDAAFQSHWRDLSCPDASFHVGVFRDRLAALLLRDQHRARLHSVGNNFELSAAQKSAHFRHPQPGIAELTIEYDGTRFLLARANGEVLINNQSLPQGSELPESCVIALGGNHRSWPFRYFITFDQSHPEVMS